MSYMWPFEWHHCRCSLHLLRLFSQGCDLAFGGCQGQVLFVYGVIEGGPVSPYTHDGRVEYCKTQAASHYHDGFSCLCESMSTWRLSMVVPSLPMLPVVVKARDMNTPYAPHSGLSDCILFSWQFLVVYRQQLRLWSDSKEHLGGTLSHQSRCPVLSGL